MRATPLAAANSLALVVSAAATLHASYWITSALATGSPVGVGHYNATALQHQTGYLHIAYSDGDKDDVMLRWWNGTAWMVETVDAGRDVARAVDLAFNAANQPAVSYAGGALKFAERNSATWTIKTVEAKNATNDVTSLVFSNGQPAISYFVTTTPRKGPAVSTLKLARRNGTTWTLASVATGVRYSSVAFDSLGNPAIAFAGDTNGDTFSDALRLARLTPAGWQVQTIGPVSSGAGAWARLAFDPATGRPWVVDSVTGAGVVRFWYQDAGGLWQAEQVGAGFRPALLVHQGVPVISYVTPDGYGLMVAKRLAGGWVGELVAGAGFGYIGESSMAVPYGTGGEPAVAYCVEIFGINSSQTLWLASPVPY